MIKAVIFDCFGVLYPDTYWTIVRLYSRDFDARRTYFHDLIKRADSGLIDKEMLWDEASDALGISRATLDGELERLDGLDKTFMQYVHDLRARGFKTSMISNVGQGFMEQIFDGYAKEEYFDDMVLSSTVGVMKPDRAIFTLAAERLGVAANECIFTDDIMDNVKAANKAGMKAVLFTHFEDFKQQLEDMLAKTNV